MTNIRYSDNQVEVGMVRYVAVTNGKRAPYGEVACHIVIAVETPIRVWDEEARTHVTQYPYRVRLATPAEEAEYLALPNQAAQIAFRVA